MTKRNHWRRWSRRARAVVGAGTVAAIASAGAGIAWGVDAATNSVPDAGGQLHACYSTSGTLKTVYLVDPSVTPSCPSGFAAVSWGQIGPSGPTGSTGPAGPGGATGPSGVTGPVGASGPMGASGTSGATGPSGPTGPQGPASAGASGPTGPAGPSGASGPSGPSGPSGGQSINWSHYDAAGTTEPAGYTFQHLETCPAGSVLNGGFESYNPATIIVSSSHADRAGNGWEVEGKNITSSPQFVTFYVYCS